MNTQDLKHSADPTLTALVDAVEKLDPLKIDSILKEILKSVDTALVVFSYREQKALFDLLLESAHRLVVPDQSKMSDFQKSLTLITHELATHHKSAIQFEALEDALELKMPNFIANELLSSMELTKAVHGAPTPFMTALLRGNKKVFQKMADHCHLTELPDETIQGIFGSSNLDGLKLARRAYNLEGFKLLMPHYDLENVKDANALTFIDLLVNDESNPEDAILFIKALMEDARFDWSLKRGTQTPVEMARELGQREIEGLLISAIEKRELEKKIPKKDAQDESMNSILRSSRL